MGRLRRIIADAGVIPSPVRGRDVRAGGCSLCVRKIMTGGRGFATIAVTGSLLMYPRWLSLLVLAMVGYLLVQGTGSRAPKAPLPQTQSDTTTMPAITAEAYPQLTVASDLDHWKRAINPAYKPKALCALPVAESPAGKPTLGVKMVEDAPGGGAPAACGDTVNLTLMVWNAQGGVAYHGALPVTLGGHALHPALDAALLGMRVGGTRTVILPAMAAMSALALPKALRQAIKPQQVTLMTVARDPD